MPDAALATRASSRRRVLELVTDAHRPVAVAELAEWTGLHPNTLRGHLQLLVDLGQLERIVAEPTSRGRPHLLYRATGSVDDPYRLLAEELASGIASDDDHGPAYVAGRNWARRLREATGDEPSTPSDENVVEFVAQALNQLGFRTETEPLGDRLYLRACPFASLAKQNRSVCEVHAGLLRGLFAELGGDLELDRLDVHVRPDLCIAHIRPQQPDTDTTIPAKGDS